MTDLLDEMYARAWRDQRAELLEMLTRDLAPVPVSPADRLRVILEAEVGFDSSHAYYHSKGRQIQRERDPERPLTPAKLRRVREYPRMPYRPEEVKP